MSYVTIADSDRDFSVQFQCHFSAKYSTVWIYDSLFRQLDSKLTTVMKQVPLIFKRNLENCNLQTTPCYSYKKSKYNICCGTYNLHTVKPLLRAAALIHFRTLQVRLLFKGGSYLRAALITNLLKNYVKMAILT